MFKLFRGGLGLRPRTTATWSTAPPSSNILDPPLYSVYNLYIIIYSKIPIVIYIPRHMHIGLPMPVCICLYISVYYFFTSFFKRIQHFPKIEAVSMSISYKCVGMQLYWSLYSPLCMTIIKVCSKSKSHPGTAIVWRIFTSSGSSFCRTNVITHHNVLYYIIEMVDKYILYGVV